MKLDYSQIMRRISAAEGNKAKWRSHLMDCYDYFLPEKNLFRKTEQGQKKDVQVFDSTAIDSLADYASRMEAQLVPPGREWMQLEAGSNIPEEDKDEMALPLEQMTSILFAHINLSNFSAQINECFLDLGISTGAILVEEGDGVQSLLRFRSVPLADLILEETQSGIVDTVWRRIKLPASDLTKIFPRVNFSDKIKKDIKDKPTKEYEFIEGVVYNENRTYTNMLIHEGEREIIFEEQADSSPWIVFRESTTSGETYGRGRAMRCLADTKLLNTAMQYYIETVELLANPIYTAVDDGLINPNTITIRPKTVIPVNDKDTINALPQSGAPELNIDLMNRLQDSIRRTMMSKPFGQIDETPVRTATEMSIRNADLAETTLSASGRIQSELLERLIQRCVYILKVNGKIADFKIDGKEIALKYTSPAAKKQDEMDVAVTLRFMETLVTMPPELINMTIKVEDVPKYIADKMGVSKSLIRTPTEMKQKESEMQQAMAAQQGAANGVQQ